MSFETTFNQLIKAVSREDFARVLEGQNIRELFIHFWENHSDRIALSHLDPLLLANKKIIRISGNDDCQTVAKLALNQLLSEDISLSDRQRNFFLNLAASLVTSSMKREDIEVIIQTVKDLSDYRWEVGFSPIVTNLAILVGCLDTEKESAARAAALVIHKNMSGDDVKAVLTQTLRLQTATRYYTLELAADLTHNQMTGKDVAKILKAIDRLEDPDQVVGDAWTLFKDTMNGDDVAKMLEGLSMLSADERYDYKHFSLIKLHLLDRLIILSELRKIPLKDRTPLIDAGLHILNNYEAGNAHTLFCVLFQIPIFNLAGCLELLDPLLKRLNPIDSDEKVDEIIRVLRAYAPFSTKVFPKAGGIVIQFKRCLEQFFNALAAFPLEQQYELTWCAYKLAENMKAFLNILLELKDIPESRRIGITHLLMVFYGHEPYLKSRYLPKLSGSQKKRIFETTRLLLNRYHLGNEKVIFIFNGLVRQNKPGYLKRLFPFLDQIKDTNSIPHFIDKMSHIPPKRHEEFFTILNNLKIQKPYLIPQIKNDLIFYNGSVLEKAYLHISIADNNRWKYLMLENSIFIPPEEYDTYFRLYNDNRCWFKKERFRWSQIFVVHSQLKEDCHRYLIEKLNNESGEAVLLADRVQQHFQDLHIPKDHPIHERCSSLLEPDDSLQLKEND